MNHRTPAAARHRVRRPVWMFLALIALTAVTACTPAEPSTGRDRFHSSRASQGSVNAPGDSAAPPGPTFACRCVNPVLDGRGGVRNFVFYNRGRNPLVPGANLSALGHPSVVVTTPRSDPRQAIEAIHSLGARAYVYDQFYWSQMNESSDGLNLAKHPGWAFCRSGNKPLLGQVVHAEQSTQRWYFIDVNERAVRAAIERQFRALKAEGWDGVFFDRGQAALAYAANAQGNPVWKHGSLRGIGGIRSTCTSHPYQKGATFADSFINALGLAHQAGLQAMMNYGTSPFDPVTPMPAEAWKHLNLVLDEMATHPRDMLWERTFQGLQQAEQNSAHGHRTVALISTGNLGGPTGQTRANVFYEWARIKLFNLAVAVNTGDIGCPPHPHNGICNLYTLYPELTDVRFGRPTAPAPAASDCSEDSKIHCVWTRSYVHGTDVLNASSQTRHDLTVRIPGGSCRYVYDVFDKLSLASNRCVKVVSLNLPPWSGRPLVFRTKAF